MRRPFGPAAALAVLLLALLASALQPAVASVSASTPAQATSKVRITGLTIAPRTKLMADGTRWRFAAIATDSTGATTKVTAATWTSLSPALARVSSTGLVSTTRLHRSGRATIRATYAGRSATAVVRVSSAGLLRLTTGPTPRTITVGQHYTLRTIGRFVGFRQLLNLSARASLSRAGVVRVRNGVVRGIAPGRVTIRLRFRTRVARAVVRVVAPPSRLTVHPVADTSTDADSDALLDMGDTQPYHYAVTNTGATTLSAVSIDSSLADAVACPTGTLAPGASLECSSTHAVTYADVAAGSLTNVATAHATGPAGPVVSAADSASVDLDRMNIAVQHGLPDIVTYGELSQKAKSLLAGHDSLAADLLPATAMSWAPSNRSKGITSYSPSQQVLLRSNHNYNGGSSVVPIAVAGTGAGSSTRMAYTSGDPFVDYTGAAATVTDAGMSAFDANLVSWLMGGADLATTTKKIVIVNGSGSQEALTRAWLVAHAPQADVNAVSSCVLPTTPSCIDGADLIIFGGTGSDTDAASIANTVTTAYAAGTPLLFFSQAWNANASDAIATQLGLAISYGSTYFDQDGLQGSTPANQLPGGLDDFQSKYAPLLSTLLTTPLTPSDYNACITDQMANQLYSKPFYSCSLGSAAFQTYRTALATWRATIRAQDATGVSSFATPRSNDQDLPRVLLLLADKIRTGPTHSLRPGDTAPTLTYPIPTTTDGTAFTRAQFADSSTETSWSGNQAAKDPGTLYCTRAGVVAQTCSNPAWPGFGDHTISLAATGGDEWQSTGLDLEPGTPATVELNASPGVAVYVRTFYQRTDTTRAAYLDGNNVSLYDRPQFVATDWVLLAPNTPTTISSPFGGPLYVRIVGSAGAKGTAVPLSFHDVATHPSVLDMTDDAQVAQFIADAGDGAYYADLGGTGFEAHMPLNYISQALSSAGAESSTGRALLYSTHGGLAQFLADFRDQYVFSVYRMAGLQIGSQPLTSTLSADDQTICQHLGLPCLDATINQRTQIQHVNYDLHASCGSLCAGNPIDASGPPVTFGWGESHELGHNLQRGQLNVSWVDTAAGSNAAARDVWTNYVNRSGEVSNNIFPYHTAWNFFRIVHPQWGLSPEPAGAVDTGNLVRDVAGVDAFSIAQSIRSGQVTSGHLAAYDASCTSHTSDAVGTPSDIAIADAIWKNGGTYDDNNLRMSFYQQIAPLVRGKVMADGTTLHNGYDIWTLLYQAARGWSQATSAQASWTAAAQSTYGMGDFAWTNTAVYGSGKNVGTMTGNDFLLITLSKITGYDWRPFFRIHGVLWTSLADQQVLDNAPAGGYASFGNTFPALGAQLPYADMSNIGTVNMTNASTAWPGAYDNSATTLNKVGFHPSSCP